MMMPANFSAISENEMTYVVGGAALENILAPALNESNWQTFNKNMITLIGNKYIGKYVGNTLGVLFGGSYVPGDIGKKFYNEFALTWGKNYQQGDKWYKEGALGVLNVGLNVAGYAAAIYNMATGNVDNVLPSAITVKK